MPGFAALPVPRILRVKVPSRPCSVVRGERQRVSRLWISIRTRSSSTAIASRIMVGMKIPVLNRSCPIAK